MGMAGMGAMVGLGGAPPPVGNCVVIVSNLNEETVNPDAVFTLFGMYGIVQRVKILYNKKDTALVQFADPLYAQNSITSLDRVRWQGKQLKVSLSKHASIQLPKEGLPDSWMTKDYTNSNLHRFKNPGPKSYTNVYPPTATLHLSNVPASMTAEDLTELFSQYGTVVAFKFFEKDRKMALLQMESQEQAVDALVGIHNRHFDGSGYLRVSFTKSVI
jgi:polypyrimidine tract-binding protein 2